MQTSRNSTPVKYVSSSTTWRVGVGGVVVSNRTLCIYTGDAAIEIAPQDAESFLAAAYPGQWASIGRGWYLSITPEEDFTTSVAFYVSDADWPVFTAHLLKAAKASPVALPDGYRLHSA